MLKACLLILNDFKLYVWYFVIYLGLGSHKEKDWNQKRKRKTNGKWLKIWDLTGIVNT